jgi:hypothetical protein
VGLPPTLLLLAQANPVTYAVDLLRHALGQPAERAVTVDLVVVVGTTVAAFVVTALLFDPEQRFTGTPRMRRTHPPSPAPARTPSD